MRGLAFALRRLRPAFLLRRLPFVGDERGVAAVEFALLLPVMMTLYLGGFEVSQAVSVNRKMSLTSRTVADLVAQAKTVTNADITNVFNAAAAVAAPFDRALLKVVVSSVNVDGDLNAKVAWSRSTANTSARAKDEAITVPAALKTANTSLIWAEVSYGYTPAIGYVISGTINLKDNIFMRPRLVTRIPEPTT